MARVTDGGNCFNLNGLAQSLPGQPGQPAVLIGNAVEVAHFAKLMRLLGIPCQVAEQVATAPPTGSTATQIRKAAVRGPA